MIHDAAHAGARLRDLEAMGLITQDDVNYMLHVSRLQHGMI